MYTRKKKSSDGPKKHKMNAKKHEADGIVFHSKMECDRYLCLKELEDRDIISALTLQPKYRLQDGFPYEGKKIRPIDYILDFSYIYEGRVYIEDVKGMATADGKLKYKMLLHLLKDEDSLVIWTKKKGGKWLNYHTEEEICQQ